MNTRHRVLITCLLFFNPLELEVKVRGTDRLKEALSPMMYHRAWIALIMVVGKVCIFSRHGRKATQACGSGCEYRDDQSRSL